MTTTPRNGQMLWKLEGDDRVLHLRIYASREGRKETSDILEGVDSNPQNTRRLVLHQL
jgi:hypothetical protein